MQPVLDRDQIRAYDAAAISIGHLPGAILMENAGRSACEAITRVLKADSNHTLHIAIACGPGNNGGDGYVLARHLLALRSGDIHVKVCLLAQRNQITGDAKLNLDALEALAPDCIADCSQNLGLLREHTGSADCVVDALFGTGLSRPVSGLFAEAIMALNDAPGVRIALDIASGLDCNTGTVLGHCVRADHTITFAHYKPGLLTPQGHDTSGVIHVGGLGLPDASLLQHTGTSAYLVDHADAATAFVKRPAISYKHRSGDVLLFAGSPGKAGAAHLAGNAALRAGAGLATVCTWPEVIPALAREATEIMLAPIEKHGLADQLARLCARRTACLIGPGFGTDADAQAVLGWLLNQEDIPLVIDADSITLLAREAELAKHLGSNMVITPHSGELGRLLKMTAAEVEADRYGAVRTAAEKYGCTVILKGAHSLICSEGKTYVSPWANAVLATAGSGDVLAGILAAFLCHARPAEAAIAAVFVHGLAAQLWQDTHKSDRGLIASDLVLLLPEAIAKLQSR